MNHRRPFGLSGPLGLLTRVLFVWGACLATAATAAPGYRVSVLAGPRDGGGCRYSAGPINNAGQALVFAEGQCTPGDSRIDFRYDGKGQRVELGETHAFQLNRQGDAVGTRYAEGQPAAGAVLRADGRLRGYISG